MAATAATRKIVSTVRQPHRFLRLWRGLSGIVALALVASAVYSVHILMRQAAEKSTAVTCRANLKMLGGALLKYVTVNRRYPSAAHWEQEIARYLTSEEADRAFQCPEAHRLSYAYNRAIAGARIEDIAEPSRCIALFECDTAHTGDLRGAAIADIAWDRHQSQAFFTMADGHVQACHKQGIADLIGASAPLVRTE